RKQAMQLLAPDILEEAGEISVAVTASGFAIGFLLWLLGWRGHRFWIVLAATIGAGVVGLYAAPAHRTHPLLAGLLRAVAAGALAENHPKLLNGTFAAIALIGVIAQFVLARRQGSESSRREARPKSSQNQGGGLWWGRGQRSYRRAG